MNDFSSKTFTLKTDDNNEITLEYNNDNSLCEEYVATFPAVGTYYVKFDV